MIALEALRLEHIVKRFPGVVALKNVDFRLEYGEVHAICGENGAGKSTLMKVVCGVYKPDEGKMFLDGNEVNFTNPNEAYEKGVAIIFQETSLFEEMTVSVSYTHLDVYKRQLHSRAWSLRMNPQGLSIPRLQMLFWTFSER